MVIDVSLLVVDIFRRNWEFIRFSQGSRTRGILLWGSIAGSETRSGFRMFYVIALDDGE